MRNKGGRYAPEYDAWSLRVVERSMKPHLKTSLVLDAFEAAGFLFCR